MKNHALLTLLFLCISGAAMNQNSVIFEDDLKALNKKVWFGNAEIVKKSLRISDSRSDIEVHLISKPFPVERSAGYLLTFKCLPLGEAVRNAGGFLAFYDAAGNKLVVKETPAAAVSDDWNLLSVKITPEEIPANASTFRIGLQPALGSVKGQGSAHYCDLFLKKFTQNKNPEGTVFFDDFSAGPDKWVGGTYEKDGFSTPGSLKIEDFSSDAAYNAISSPFKLDRKKSYILSGRIRTNGKVTSYSCFYLMMYDSKGNFVSALESNMVKSDRWTKSVIKIMPSQLPSNASEFRIMLQAAAGVAAEKGVAWFDNIELKEYSFVIPPEFSAYSGELAYTDKLFIKGSSGTDAYMNPSAMLTDGDVENFWMPSEADTAPWLELSHGKKEFPHRLVLKFENEVPEKLAIAAWDDESGMFSAKQYITLKNNHAGVAEYILDGYFPACRKLKIQFPGKLSGYVSELRYFITPEKRENWNAYWVWAKNQNSTANYEEFTTRVFRRVFDIKSIPVKAVIQGKGDDSLELFLNGKAIQCGEELKDKLLPGKNILAARITNDRYAAGLLAELDILCDDGSEIKIVSDRSWKTSLLPVPDSWNTLRYDDSKWAYCEETAQPPFGPWGEIPYVLNSKRIALSLSGATVPESFAAGTETVLKFEFFNDRKNTDFQPLTMKISRNNETFFEEVIAEKAFFKDFQGAKILEYTLKLSEFLYPGIYDIELKMPFHDIVTGGKTWKKKIKIINSRECEPSIAEIVKQGNLSHFVLNGKINRSIWYTFPYAAGRNTQRLMSREFGKADCNISQIFVVPRIINSCQFDFTAIDRAVSDALETNPESYIILKTQLNQLYPEFIREYPQELCTLDNMRTLSYPSHASEVWKKISGEMLKSLIDHINHSPFADRVIGYFILSGEEGQWFHHWGDTDITKAGSISDYSPAMLKFFRNYLKNKYKTIDALQKAWNSPNVTFDNAEIPSREKRIRPHHNGMFRTAADQEAIDFGEALSQCVNETMGFYASIIKKATNRKALVFAYYGHLMDVGDGFLAELGGYLKQEQLLQNPDIDGFAGPLSYRPEFRDIGSPSSIDFPPSGSTRLHKKITIQEDDLRTHLFPKEYAYTIRMPWQSNAVLAREFAKTLCDGAFMYLHEFGTDTRNWFDDPEYLAEIRKLNQLGIYLTENKDLSPLHEIAVITDDHTLNFLNQKPRYIQRNVPETRAIYMRETIGKTGVPYTEYLLSSFLNPEMPDHKLYIFLNTYKITSAQKKAIMQKLARNQAAALFLYAPGIIADGSTPDVKNMENLLSMKIKRIENWTSPLRFDFSVQHKGKMLEITSGMMTGDTLDDLYAVNDLSATTLARLHKSGDSVLAVKKQNGSDIYFASFPFFSPEILRYIAEKANVHVYMETDDAFYRAGDVFAVHTNKVPGERTIRLPQKMTVRQLYPGKKNLGSVDVIKFHCSTPETRIYEIIK